ncbi:MAG: cupin domain-containing protein [Terriglobales bacterium]
MAAAFKQKVPSGTNMQVELRIQPATSDGYINYKESAVERWLIQVTPGKDVAVSPFSGQNAPFIFFVTRAALRLLATGAMSPITASIQTHPTDPTLLDWKRRPDIAPSVETEKQLELFTHFFNPSLPQMLRLGTQYSRKAHGVDAVGLYYWPGMRSAWHHLENGDRLNQQPHANPFHGALIITGGSGIAIIGDKTVAVHAGESYYLPPNTKHSVWNESASALEFIWIAWGDGA